MIQLEEYSIDTTSKVATIGFFDGLHRGHSFILQELNRVAAECNLQTLVLSFTNHPRLLFDPECNLKLLTLADEKRDLLDEFGVDYSLFLDFTYELASKSSRSFIEYLAKYFGVKVLLVGYDHHFGSDKNSSLADYVKFGEEFGVVVICCDAYNEGDIMVSSSKVRAALNCGDVKQASKLLGYDYFLSGTVVHGSKIGRSIGFPTANLQVDDLKLLPAEGVYAVTVKLEGDEIIYNGMLNIGTRPTVDGANRTVEVHIFDFNNDLYDATITLFFKDYVRKEKKFGDLTELKGQLNDDFSTVKSLFLQNS